LLRKKNFSELLSLLKRMNRSLANLDLIHPGQTILIPLNIVPLKGFKKEVKADKKSVMGIGSLEDVEFDNYVVKPGDTLLMIAKNKVKISPEYLYEDYLKLVQKFNPTLTNPDLIYPDQVIRLPIYSPQIVRMPIEKKEGALASKKTERMPAQDTAQTLALKQGLREIFTQMGEEWVDTGEQFIPLKSGGQVNLRTDTFPLLNLSSGRRLVIDLHNELPKEISQLIESDWEEYQVVHRTIGDTLATMIDKILATSNYHKVFKSGESFSIPGDIEISVAGDWTIIPQKSRGTVPEKIVALTLIDHQVEHTSPTLRQYLEKLGIKVIDYPDTYDVAGVESESPAKGKIQINEQSEFPVPTHLLALVGQTFSSGVTMPVYQSEGSGFNLIIQADLFFHRKGKDCLIDMTGLSPAIVSLLEKHQIRVLSLAGENDPISVTARILEFLGLPFVSKRHNFPAAPRDEGRCITFTLLGVRFHDHEGKKILATNVIVQNEFLQFLHQRGYYVLELTELIR
jgi:hypothetical protein